RLANPVDDLVAEASRDGTEELLLRAVDRDDLVLVVAALERRVPAVAGVADREVEALVLHLADVDDRRRRDAGRGRKRGVEQEVVRLSLEDVDDDVQVAVEEGEVGADVRGAVLLPLQIHVTQRRLAEARL